MKRLTGRAPDGTAYLYNMGGTNAAIDRLAAYEDTGMEPEELEYIARAKRGEHMVTDEELRQAGVSQAEINALEEIAAVIAEGRPIALMPRWIPVTERVPEEEKKRYWVCTDTEYQCECRWTNNRFGMGEFDEWGWSIFDIPQYSHVVAWMPLPEPPEEVTDQ